MLVYANYLGLFFFSQAYYQLDGDSYGLQGIGNIDNLEPPYSGEVLIISSQGYFGVVSVDFREILLESSKNIMNRRILECSFR